MSWRDMAEWASLTNSAPSGDEWRILRAMDAAFLAAVRDKPTLSAAPPDAISSGRPLTPELFDAIFP